MDERLKKRILTNPFADDLLSSQINESAYDELQDLLNELAIEWRSQQFVDKDVVLDLYTVASVVRNKIVEFRVNNRAADANRLEDMFIEIDRLIAEECLCSSRERKERADNGHVYRASHEEIIENPNIQGADGAIDGRVAANHENWLIADRESIPRPDYASTVFAASAT